MEQTEILQQKEKSLFFIDISGLIIRILPHIIDLSPEQKTLKTYSGK